MWTPLLPPFSVWAVLGPLRGNINATAYKDYLDNNMATTLRQQLGFQPLNEVHKDMV